MRFAKTGDKTFAQRRTSVYELELLEIESGRLKGARYFRPILAAGQRERYARFPANFLQNELLALDADDADALLAFQCTYGQLATPPIFDADKSAGNLVFMPDASGSALRFAGTNGTTARVNASLKRKHPKGTAFIEVVSLDEASETVKMLQGFVRSTTNAAMGLAGVGDTLATEDFIRMANDVRCRYFPPYVAFFDSTDPNRETVDVPLAANVILMQAEALASGKAYHPCSVCGRLKQFTRRQPKPGERCYCCETCRVQDKSRRQYARRKQAQGKE